MGTPGTSRCQFFAFAIAVVLIVFDLSTTILVRDTRADIKCMRERIYKLENFSTIQSVSDETSGIEESTGESASSETQPFQSSHNRINLNEPAHQAPTVTQKSISKSRFPNDEKKLFSDGGNDKPPPDQKQTCANSEHGGYFTNESRIFYTLYTPTSKTQNPDISSVHLADHQIFEMTPNFEGRLSPNLTNFDLKNRTTLIYVHGFLSSSYDKSSLLKQLFTATTDYNLIMMDWRVLAGSKKSNRKRRDLSWSDKLLSGAKDLAFQVGVKTLSDYPAAFKNRHFASRELYLLLEIILQQLPASDIHLIGHSLGAHLAGEASHYLNKNTGVKIGRITGLDPASLCFTETDEVAMQKQLSKDKADFVDVWHTNSNLDMNSAGLARPVGHVDYWVNGGKFQPICKMNQTFNKEMGLGGLENFANGGVGPCSHALVNQYFIDSLMRCKGSGFGDSETGFRSSKISREEMHMYQHNGLGEVTINITSDVDEAGPDMGFWSGKDGFLNDDDFSSGDLLSIENENPNPYDFGKYHEFWSESQNFLVFTRKNVTNPNKIGEIETKYWEGYCNE